MAWRNKPDGYLKNILTAKVGGGRAERGVVERLSWMAAHVSWTIGSWHMTVISTVISTCGSLRAAARPLSACTCVLHVHTCTRSAPHVHTHEPCTLSACTHRHLPRKQVYKIAVETPLQEAQQLSKQLGSTIMLKREDLQVGGGSTVWRLVLRLGAAAGLLLACRGWPAALRVLPFFAPSSAQPLPP